MATKKAATASELKSATPYPKYGGSYANNRCVTKQEALDHPASGYTNSGGSGYSNNQLIPADAITATPVQTNKIITVTWPTAAYDGVVVSKYPINSGLDVSNWDVYTDYPVEISWDGSSMQVHNGGASANIVTVNVGTTIYFTLIEEGGSASTHYTTLRLANQNQSVNING